MNIEISKEELSYLWSISKKPVIIGSRLYGVATEESDTDYFYVYPPFDIEAESGFPNTHQFWYKDVENNADHIFTSYTQFWKNLFSGDSTINADILLFSDMKEIYTKEEVFSICNTFNVLKAFIGFAKRDLRQCAKKPKKLIHAARGLYCAEQILNGQLPELSEIAKIYSQPQNKEELVKKEAELRKLCNEKYDAGKIERYYIPTLDLNSLEAKLLNSNNIKEFKYEND